MNKNMYFLAFGTSLKDFDARDLRSAIEYQYARVRDAIERDWTGANLPVSLLDKQFLRLWK